MYAMNPPDSNMHKLAVQGVNAVYLPPSWAHFLAESGPLQTVRGRCLHCSGDVRLCDCKRAHRALQKDRKARRRRARGGR